MEFKGEGRRNRGEKDFPKHWRSGLRGRRNPADTKSGTKSGRQTGCRGPRFEPGLRHHILFAPVSFPSSCHLGIFHKPSSQISLSLPPFPLSHSKPSSQSKFDTNSYKFCHLSRRSSSSVFFPSGFVRFRLTRIGIAGVSCIEMDWSNVTAEDLIEALREVEWSSPPRPLSEFFSRFTVPRSYSKWNSRLKCNLYYYRTNYFITIVFILGLGFLRRPTAIVAAALTALSIAFLNDSFAGTFNEKVTRTVRQFSPHLAAKMRPPLTPVIRGRPSAKRAIYICGRPRWVFVLIFCTASFFLWFVSCGLLTVLWAFSIGLLATILHASFRTPNLKARLNTFREEFRAVWRNYSEL